MSFTGIYIEIKRNQLLKIHFFFFELLKKSDQKLFITKKITQNDVKLNKILKEEIQSISLIIC